MRKLLTMIMAMVLMTGMMAVFAEDSAYTASVSGGALHLRKEADKKSGSLGRYRSGTVVVLLADGDEFVKVKTPDGKTGYMMKEFLEIKNGLPPKEVVTPTPAPTPDMTRQNALERGIDPNKPMIALTFDDGPMPESERVLNALAQYDAKATFFILGKNIEGNEAVLRRMVEEGHQVGAHSWSHPNLTKISQSAVMSQMTRTMDKVKEITGYDITMMRPPYGALHRISRRPMIELNLPVILWSIDSLDWKTRNAGSTVREILNQAQNGAIVLCHDVWDSTGAAMETLIPQLMEKGYQLVTVAEMMSFRSEPLKPGNEYGFLDVKKIEPGITLPVSTVTPKPQ